MLGPGESTVGAPVHGRLVVPCRLASIDLPVVGSNQMSAQSACRGFPDLVVRFLRAPGLPAIYAEAPVGPAHAASLESGVDRIDVHSGIDGNESGRRGHGRYGLVVLGRVEPGDGFREKGSPGITFVVRIFHCHTKESVHVELDETVRPGVHVEIGIVAVPRHT